MLLFLLSFSGFIISDIPVYFRWIGKISYLTYAFAAVVRSQFDAMEFYDAEVIAPCNGRPSDSDCMADGTGGVSGL